MVQEIGVVRAMPRAHRSPFFACSALVMLGCVLLSFPLTYFMPVATGSRHWAPLFHIHGAAFFGWIFLYAWQTRLAATGRVALHRELGLAGIALSAIMIPLGLAAAIMAARQRLAHGDPQPFAFTFYNMVDIGLFAAMMTASIASVTRHLDWHRRFTFAAALCLVGPAISRWFLPFPALPPFTDFGPNILADLFLVALIVHDRRTLGRVHPATIWVTAILVPIHLATPYFVDSAGWRTLAPALLHLTG